ncbi:TetR/AcrR family transcriptional regulator [Methylomonas sp. AM2-LC]|uniref:TetR/AcrR family transcriptional regulator n=1 Tax=Methylomonas sp. AM2-LC TaxID=3153301 RepID=UPI00326709B5
MSVKDLVPEKARSRSGRPKSNEKREQILVAAAIHFVEKGYELTSMAAVAKSADVSKLTIYSHFANKADLFKESIQQRCDRQLAPATFNQYAKLPVAEGLLQLGNMLVTLVFDSDSIRLLRILHAEATHHPDIVKIFYEAAPQRVKAAFGELLKDWAHQGQLQVADIPLATEQFFSLLKGELHVKTMLSLTEKLTTQELDTHVQACVRLFLAGYQTKNVAGLV